MDFMFSLFFERPKSVSDWDLESPTPKYSRQSSENVGSPTPTKINRFKEQKPLFIKTIRIDN